jgi:transposase
MAKETKVPHTKEFKEEAVRLTVTSGKTSSQVAKDRGISLNTLYSWRTQARDERRLPISETETPEQKIKRLERELRMVTEERDIIKKAIAYFAQPPKK